MYLEGVEGVLFIADASDDDSHTINSSDYGSDNYFSDDDHDEYTDDDEDDDADLEGQLDEEDEGIQHSTAILAASAFDGYAPDGDNNCGNEEVEKDQGSNY